MNNKEYKRYVRAKKVIDDINNMKGGGGELAATEELIRMYLDNPYKVESGRESMYMLYAVGDEDIELTIKAIKTGLQFKRIFYNNWHLIDNDNDVNLDVECDQMILPNCETHRYCTRHDERCIPDPTKYYGASIEYTSYTIDDVREMLTAADLVGDKSYDDYLKHHGSGENRALALRSGLRYGATQEKDLYFTMFCIQD